MVKRKKNEKEISWELEERNVNGWVSLESVFCETLPVFRWRCSHAWSSASQSRGSSWRDNSVASGRWRLRYKCCICNSDCRATLRATQYESLLLKTGADNEGRSIFPLLAASACWLQWFHLILYGVLRFWEVFRQRKCRCLELILSSSLHLLLSVWAVQWCFESVAETPNVLYAEVLCKTTFKPRIVCD